MGSNIAIAKPQPSQCFGAEMDKVISSADANRNFSKLLREVREGYSYVITGYGRLVARIIPAHDH